jgi:hypothetical protein
MELIAGVAVAASRRVSLAAFGGSGSEDPRTQPARTRVARPAPHANQTVIGRADGSPAHPVVAV